MTDDAQRLALAKVCFPGYSAIPITWWYTQEYDNTRDYVWAIKDGPFQIRSVKVPDYLDDLAAVYDAEDKLDGYMMLKYTDILLSITGGAAGSFGHIHASARQRVEALLKVFNKWDDSK